MLLAPGQLQRAGMTGNVPYYGGRFTPAQAYAASHPTGTTSGAPAPHQADALRALQYLFDARIISPDEYEALRRRVPA
jgi:hypothetical protein